MKWNFCPLNKGAVNEVDWGIYKKLRSKIPPIGYANRPPLLRGAIQILLSLFLLSFTSLTLANKLQSATISHTETSTIIALQLAEAPLYKQLNLTNPQRFVIDLSNTPTSNALNNLALKNTFIKSLRTGLQPKNTLRIVIEPTLDAKLSVIPKQNGLQLLITPNDRSVVKTVPPPPVALRDIVIVLDPGHGGTDPGAIGPRGTQEKNVTLAIAKAVREDLSRIPGIKIYMTRDRDTYPTLGQRLALARRVKADMFISIHADSFHRRAARGVTIFALSEGRATSEAGRWIAEQENRSELVGGVDLADKNKLLRSVLVDLSQTATISSSLLLGQSIFNEVKPFAILHSHRIEQASLYVLTSPDIPAVLVETGFISNPQEEALLRSPAYQAKMANAISEGLLGYLKAYPIENTAFSSRLFVKTYIVKSGDSLESIAKAYQVPYSKLDTLYGHKPLLPGQVIRIPS